MVTLSGPDTTVEVVVGGGAVVGGADVGGAVVLGAGVVTTGAALELVATVVVGSMEVLVADGVELLVDVVVASPLSVPLQAIRNIAPARIAAARRLFVFAMGATLPARRIVRSSLLHIHAHIRIFLHRNTLVPKRRR